MLNIDIFKDKRVVVAGGTGMIGRYLVDILLELKANIIVASLDSPDGLPQGVDFVKTDLTYIDNCMNLCKGADYVFNLVGIKCSPDMVKKKPASSFVPMILFNISMMHAAFKADVKGYLYTSTIGVYPPAEIFYEDDVWKGFPSENDKFGGWTKRMGELQIEAYQIEHNWHKAFIVRPANVYGRFDNFDPNNAMVIPSLINRALGGENPFVVWGDGSPIRDFIHAYDCAKGMVQVMNNKPPGPINLGSGSGVSIKKIVDVIVSNLDNKPEVIWDTSKPSGDKIRLMNMDRAKEWLNFELSMSIEGGIKDTMNWFRENNTKFIGRHNYFK